MYTSNLHVIKNYIWQRTREFYLEAVGLISCCCYCSADNFTQLTNGN